MKQLRLAMKLAPESVHQTEIEERERGQREQEATEKVDERLVENEMYLLSPRHTHRETTDQLL